MKTKYVENFCFFRQKSLSENALNIWAFVDVFFCVCIRIIRFINIYFCYCSKNRSWVCTKPRSMICFLYCCVTGSIAIQPARCKFHPLASFAKLFSVSSFPGENFVENLFAAVFFSSRWKHNNMKIEKYRTGKFAGVPRKALIPIFGDRNKRRQIVDASFCRTNKFRIIARIWKCFNICLHIRTHSTELIEIDSERGVGRLEIFLFENFFYHLRLQRIERRKVFGGKHENTRKKFHRKSRNCSNLFQSSPVKIKHYFTRQIKIFKFRFSQVSFIVSIKQKEREKFPSRWRKFLKCFSTLGCCGWIKWQMEKKRFCEVRWTPFSVCFHDFVRRFYRVVLLFFSSQAFSTNKSPHHSCVIFLPLHLLVFMILYDLCESIKWIFVYALFSGVLTRFIFFCALGKQKSFGIIIVKHKTHHSWSTLGWALNKLCNEISISRVYGKVFFARVVWSLLIAQLQKNIDII